MNTSTSSEAIDSELVAEVVRMMRKERLTNASAATNLVVCQSKRFFGNTVPIAVAAQELYDKENSSRRSPPRPWSHANASHEALAAKERATR